MLKNNIEMDVKKRCIEKATTQAKTAENIEISSLYVNKTIRNKEQIMSYHFIDRKDPHIDVMFQGLEKLEKMLSVLEEIPRTLFNGERFLTDEELSNVLRVSRRTLQEYRTSGVIPYFLVQGKALYKESDIMKILDDAYKRCREEQRWV